MKTFYYILVYAASCYHETGRTTKGPSNFFLKGEYAINKLLNKIQCRDLHWNEIQYEFEVEDDVIDAILVMHANNHFVTPRTTFC